MFDKWPWLLCLYTLLYQRNRIGLPLFHFKVDKTAKSFFLVTIMIHHRDGGSLGANAGTECLAARQSYGHRGNHPLSDSTVQNVVETVL